MPFEFTKLIPVSFSHLSLTNSSTLLSLISIYPTHPGFFLSSQFTQFIHVSFSHPNLPNYFLSSQFVQLIPVSFSYLNLPNSSTFFHSSHFTQLIHVSFSYFQMRNLLPTYISDSDSIHDDFLPSSQLLLYSSQS